MGEKLCFLYNWLWGYQGEQSDALSRVGNHPRHIWVMADFDTQPLQAQGLQKNSTTSSGILRLLCNLDAEKLPFDFHADTLLVGIA